MEQKSNTFTQIYDIVRQIPYGKVATYGQIAELAGNKRLSRVVGYALHVNPDPDGIPCYRVELLRCGLSGLCIWGREPPDRASGSGRNQSDRRDRRSEAISVEQKKLLNPLHSTWYIGIADVDGQMCVGFIERRAFLVKGGERLSRL